MKKNEDIKWDPSNPVRFTHIAVDGEIHKLDNMIKANELRLGNWVLAEGNPYKIKHISPDDEWEPIPLISEILEKSGFIKQGVIDQYYNHKIDWAYYANNGKLFIGCDNENGYEVPMKIKYIHQLQNLYFALTGTELEIKL